MRKIDFVSCSKYFFGETPYEKDQRIEKCEKSILLNVQNNFFDTSVYLRNITF